MVETNISQQLQQQQLPPQQQTHQISNTADLKRGNMSPMSPSASPTLDNTFMTSGGGSNMLPQQQQLPQSLPQQQQQQQPGPMMMNQPGNWSPLSATSATSVSLPSPIQSMDNHNYGTLPSTSGNTGGTSTTTTTTNTQGISSATMEEPDNIQVINEKPVLERVEKIQHTDLHKRVHIHEKYVQDLIEIREQPMVKRFVHPVQQVKIIDDPVYQVEGKEQADLEVQRLMEEFRLRDVQQQVQVEQRSDVKVHNYEPTKDVEKQLVKHYVVTKPVITEIHEQPIEEIHEQIIQRIIYEKPILRVVRAERNVTEIVERAEQMDVSQMYQDQKAVPLSTSAVDSFPKVAPGSEFILPSQSINKSPIGMEGVGSELTTGPATTFTAPPPPPPAPTHGLLFSRKGKNIKPSPVVTAPTTAAPLTTTTSLDTKPHTVLSSTATTSSPKVRDVIADTTTTTTTTTTASPPLENVVVEPSETAQDVTSSSKKSKVPRVGFGASVNEEIGQRLARKKKDSDLL